jgi:hypothetical protein
MSLRIQNSLIGGHDQMIDSVVLSGALNKSVRLEQVFLKMDPRRVQKVLNKSTYLVLAASLGDLELCRVLVRFGKTNETISSGLLACIYPRLEGGPLISRLKCFEFLIQHLDARQTCNLEPVFHGCCREGLVVPLKLLLELEMVNVDCVDARRRKSGITTAVENQDAEVIRALVAANAACGNSFDLAANLKLNQSWRVLCEYLPSHWTPSLHHAYPKSFRMIVVSLMSVVYREQTLKSVFIQAIIPYLAALYKKGELTPQDSKKKSKNNKSWLSNFLKWK